MKNAEAFSSNDKILTPLRTLNELLRFVIPKGNKEMPIRITLALMFLIFATLVSVYTPFLYGKAVDIVIKQQKVSTSYIQRYLQIGYNRAARIVEKMEEDGIISEANNSGKRHVLKK